MNRIVVIAFLCTSLIIARPAEAQQTTRIYRIGWLGYGAAAAPSLTFEALRIGMRDLSHVEGKTYVFEQRWWNGRGEELPALVDGLLGANVDIIVAQGPAAQGVKNITRVPVVFGFSGDPVLAGFVHSLARPGGNMTGATYMSVEINGKRLELVREAFPQVARVGLLSNPQHAGEHLEIAESQAAALRLGLSIQYIQARTLAEIDAALATMKEGRAEAIIALPDGLIMQHRATIIEAAARNRIPVVSGWSDFAQSGGVMTYGPNLRDSWRRVAPYVDKILKGAKPADLPVEQPTRFELVVNLKTAKALGITIPQSILARADEVIE
jgi:putative tryptophan/tyrosine transport system substrate-binding protein